MRKPDPRVDLAVSLYRRHLYQQDNGNVYRLQLAVAGLNNRESGRYYDRVVELRREWFQSLLCQ